MCRHAHATAAPAGRSADWYVHRATRTTSRHATVDAATSRSAKRRSRTAVHRSADRSLHTVDSTARATGGSADPERERRRAIAALNKLGYSVTLNPIQAAA